MAVKLLVCFSWTILYHINCDARCLNVRRIQTVYNASVREIYNCGNNRMTNVMSYSLNTAKLLNNPLITILSLWHSHTVTRGVGQGTSLCFCFCHHRNVVAKITMFSCVNKMSAGHGPWYLVWCRLRQSVTQWTMMEQ